MAREGRPLGLNDEIAERVRQALRGRNVIEASAAMAGVPRRTLYDWLRHGRRVADALDEGAPESDFTPNELALADFSLIVTRALAEAEVQTVALIGAAGTNPSRETKTTTKVVGVDAQGAPVMATETTVTERPPDWRALAWLAERRWGHWAPTQRQEISGPEGGPIPVENRIDGILGRLERARGVLETTADEVPADEGAGG